MNTNIVKKFISNVLSRLFKFKFAIVGKYYGYYTKEGEFKKI